MLLIRSGVGALLLHLLVTWLAILPKPSDGLIITSVIAGDKKFKTISFDSKFLKPLTFESELPLTEFRRHRTMRPPKFDIDVNIPIKLPIEEEYPQEEYKKPVTSDLFFQSGDIHEPSYGKKGNSATYDSNKPKQNTYRDDYVASSSSEKKTEIPAEGSRQLGLLPTLAKSIKFRPQITIGDSVEQQSNARSDANDVAAQSQLQQASMVAQESYQNGPSIQQQANYGDKYPDFVPGGYVNLKLSGPSGGPKMTYEDYDREKWAQTLSQTPGAMPVPILDYHQLQNFYGGLGTFTNGLPDNRYVETSLKEKLLSGFGKLTDKFHIGRR